MGAKASTANGGQSPRTRTFSTSSSSEVVSSGAGFSLLRAIPGIQVTNDRQRARSLSSVPDLHASHEAIAIPPNSQSYEASAAASPDTDSSSNEEAGPVPGTSLALGRVYATHSLPSHIWSINEGSLGRLRVRGTYRGEQLQYILAETQREENLLGVGQQGESATDADPRESAARQPVPVRTLADEAVGRAQADPLPAAAASRQAEAASAAT